MPDSHRSCAKMSNKNPYHKDIIEVYGIPALYTRKYTIKKCQRNGCYELLPFMLRYEMDCTLLLRFSSGGPRGNFTSFKGQGLGHIVNANIYPYLY